MRLKIAVVANTLKRVDYELRRFVEANEEDVAVFAKYNRIILFRDGTIMRGHTTKDNVWMKSEYYDQVFLTHDLEYCQPLIDMYYRMESRSYIPNEYLFMTMEDC